MTKRIFICIIKKNVAEVKSVDNYFNISSRHEIRAANHNNFATPTPHPDRNMNQHDFIYMLDGEWIIGQEGEEFHIKSGDVLILAANHSHYGIKNCTAGTKTMYIHAMFDGGNTCDNPESDTVILDSLIKVGGNTAVKNIFEKIIYAKSSKNELLASVYFDTLLCELRACMKRSSSNLAEDIRQLIVSSEKIPTNTEIAKALSVSVKTAENTFKAAYGTTLHKYAIEAKIEEAKFYLSNFPNMKLYEIAQNLGFCDEFHLSRHFKNAVGLAPGEYRKTKAGS